MTLCSVCAEEGHKRNSKICKYHEVYKAWKAKMNYVGKINHEMELLTELQCVQMAEQSNREGALSE